MRLFSYCLRHDDGAAPNPFFGICTLNICKPRIRSVAKKGDWVVGVGSKNVKGKDYSGKIVYAMKVTNTMTMKEYAEYCKKTLPEKIPDTKHQDYRRKVGDSIYTFDNGKASLLSSVHSESEKRTDLGGKRTLLSEHFYYFGDNPIEIPDRFRSMIKQSQGHKSNANDFIKEEFVFWLENQNFIINHLYGEPQTIDFKRNKKGKTAKSSCSNKIEKSCGGIF